jgi:hypothetical protein
MFLLFISLLVKCINENNPQCIQWCIKNLMKSKKGQFSSNVDIVIFTRIWIWITYVRE